jgi:adenosylhomocysteine nucleosidase
MKKVLVVTPLVPEQASLAEYFQTKGYAAESPEEKTPISVFPKLGLEVAVAGHGKAQFALVTQHLIDKRGPYGLVIIAGAAGGLRRDLDAGDVVVSTEIVEHDFKSRFQGEKPPPRFPCNPALVAEILGIQPSGLPFATHSGPIAGGDEDIIEAHRAHQLHLDTDSICVAWEGGGGAKAAIFSDIPYIEVRAITDAADEEAVEHFHMNLDEAVKNIGVVLEPWLLSRLG